MLLVETLKKEKEELEKNTLQLMLDFEKKYNCRVSISSKARPDYEGGQILDRVYLSINF